MCVRKKITFVLFRKINQFVFVSNLERYRSVANSNAGILTNPLWDEAVSSMAQANQVGQQQILQGVVIDENEQQEAEEQVEEDDPLKNKWRRVRRCRTKNDGRKPTSGNIHLARR